MRKPIYALGGAGLLLSVSMSAVFAQTEWTTPPDPPEFAAQSEPVFVSGSDIQEYKALPEYHEPDFVKAFVDAGKLPPVAERLPKEPLVFKTPNMPDGMGVYGDTMRHVIGGRPDGWNYIGGATQGWGGIDIGMYECLTRTGPLFQVKADELEPLPNLAKSWEWSEDGHELTMHLIEGAKWSDGEPFGADDVMFYWEDNVLDTNVAPTGGATPESFGEGTTLEKIDDATVKWTFKQAKPTQFLYAMAYGTFCPGPAHILKPQHPKYSENNYDQYKNAFPPEFLNFPVMGAWVPVEYRPDDVIVLRRNPYYWKVDENGNQLPYLNEVSYRLSSWADRDVQTIAGTADFSNLEQPENFVESLRRAAEETAPARLQFGARTIGYTLYPNLSGNGWGEPNELSQAVRELNRNIDFRKAITYAIDRKSLGESLVKGPFTTPYPGGLYAGTSFYDKDSTAFFGYDMDKAKEYLAKAGLEDTDGNGVVNFPSGTAGGQDVQITMLVNADYTTDKSLAEGVLAQMEALGIRVILDTVSGNSLAEYQQGGKYDWAILRNGSDLVSVVQGTAGLAPVGPRTAFSHRAGTDGTLDLMPFEQEMVDTVNKFIASADNAERADLMKTYQQIYTQNLYAIGLTQYPGALLINKRFANIPAGAPIFQFNWAEDNVIRERLYVPADKQTTNELHPNTLPNTPGVGNGPISN